GGNVAENAGGIRCFKYGVTANYVLGVECIMTDGTIRQFGGPAGGRGVSNTLDWRALMPGSEGMIAVFTKIWMRIKPLPEKVWTFLGSYKNLEDATACITDLVQSPAMPVALEFIDNHVVQLVENSKMACGLDKDSWVILTEVDGPEQLVDHAADTIEEIMNRHNPIKVEKTDDETEKLKLWKARKVAGGLMGQISPDLMIQDAVIPRQFLKDILHFLYDEGEKRDIHVLNVFHAGDGNLHPNFLFDRKIEGDLERVKDLGSALMEKVIAYGGTLSGEHGIGNDKRDYIPKIFSVREVSAQSAISEIFNPTHQLNPEKVFPYRSFVGCCAAEKQNT
ncbi:MAG: FAD-binding protein, partial [Lentisphaeria bacterium]|nr:FAD-binding protein [Lentisphaeria bacterium]